MLYSIINLKAILKSLTIPHPSSLTRVNFGVTPWSDRTRVVALKSGESPLVTLEWPNLWNSKKWRLYHERIFRIAKTDAMSHFVRCPWANLAHFNFMIWAGCGTILFFRIENYRQHHLELNGDEWSDCEIEPCVELLYWQFVRLRLR